MQDIFIANQGGLKMCRMHIQGDRQSWIGDMSAALGLPTGRGHNKNYVRMWITM